MRCSYAGRHGQCTHQAVDSSEFCKRHSNESDRMRGYRFTNPDIVARFGHHNDEEALKTVEQEIALLRTMIEDRLESAESKADRLSAYTTVTPMIGQVNKLVDNLAKLRKTSSSLLSKEALYKLSEQIVAILIDELNDIPGRDSVIDRVAERISDAIKETRNDLDK